MKILLSQVLEVEQAGAYRLTGWSRKKNNRIDEQDQRWLQKKEYFFSAHTQRRRKDEKELKRRANQDDVRKEHRGAILDFLKRYRHCAAVIRDAFIPNYTTTLYDNFQVSLTIKRLFRYGLIEKDIECEKYAGHDFEKVVEPHSYWKQVVDNLNTSNIQDVLLNPITLEIAPELRLYKQDSLTHWYVERIFCRTITETSDVFGSYDKYPNKTSSEVCDMVREDFAERDTEPEYHALFDRFRITQDIITQAIKATLNEQGRKDEFKEWAKNSGSHARFHDILKNYQQPSTAYTTLNIPRTATAQEIKSTFRTLCHKHHPDHGGDPEKFREVKEAYDNLRS